MAGLSGSTPYAGFARVVRGATVGGLATGLAAGGHALGGGASPSPAGIIAMAALAAPLCVRMSTLEWTLRRLVGVLLVAQAAFHLGFMGLAPAHHAPSPLLMAAWHVVATGVSVIVLRYAERALNGLVTRVVLHLVSAILAPALVPGKSSQPLALPRAGLLGPSWQRSLRPLRGPPAAA